MEEEISLAELVAILKKRMTVIVSVGLIMLILAAIFTFFISTPKYSSTTQILVNRKSESAESIQLTDIQIINKYNNAIKEPVSLNQIKDKLDLDLTTTELSDRINIYTQDNTQEFSVSVIDESPVIAAKIANEVAATFQNQIGNLMNIENVTIVSKAIPKDEQISPNNLLNLVVGLFVGFVLGVGVAFLLEIIDEHILDYRLSQK